MAHVDSSFIALAFITNMIQNVNLHHLVQSKWKISERQWVL